MHKSKKSRNKNKKEVIIERLKYIFKEKIEIKR